MVLTVVVGSSGSGKTTFLNDTVKSHKCTYIKQYHSVRPYVVVSRIPNFDPSRLPYWNIYDNEGKASTIKVGGTMAGEFTPGLSGGQRKLMLFELICQRAEGQKDLLLVLDEPFAGLTDDFVPFIVDRLNTLRTTHNILLVTNDHVQQLKEMADNTITVSAIDRSTVQINGMIKVDREKAILALSVGNDYKYTASTEDVKFFFDTEIASNKGLLSVTIFTIVLFGLFIATFWDSSPDSGALILVASFFFAFFAINPWLLALVDWRTYMSEEADALLHASKSMNKLLMSLLAIFLIVIVSLVEWGCVNAVVDGFEEAKFWVAILMDSLSLMLPYIFFGIHTKLPFTSVEIYSSIPFLLMMFFSTTFSPGSGVEGLKVLRYLFVRFYFWCMIPGVQNDMENCPDDNLLVPYMILAALIGTVLFLIYQAIAALSRSMNRKKELLKKNNLRDSKFADLQLELHGPGTMTNARESMALRSLRGLSISGSGSSESGSNVD